MQFDPFFSDRDVAISPESLPKEDRMSFLRDIFLISPGWFPYDFVPQEFRHRLPIEDSNCPTVSFRDSQITITNLDEDNFNAYLNLGDFIYVRVGPAILTLSEMMEGSPKFCGELGTFLLGRQRKIHLYFQFSKSQGVHYFRINGFSDEDGFMKMNGIYYHYSRVQKDDKEGWYPVDPFEYAIAKHSCAKIKKIGFDTVSTVLPAQVNESLPLEQWVNLFSQSTNAFRLCHGLGIRVEPTHRRMMEVLKDRVCIHGGLCYDSGCMPAGLIFSIDRTDFDPPVAFSYVHLSYTTDGEGDRPGLFFETYVTKLTYELLKKIIPISRSRTEAMKHLICAQSPVVLTKEGDLNYHITKSRIEEFENANMIEDARPYDIVVNHFLPSEVPNLYNGMILTSLFGCRISTELPRLSFGISTPRKSSLLLPAYSVSEDVDLSRGKKGYIEKIEVCSEDYIWNEFTLSFLPEFSELFPIAPDLAFSSHRFSPEERRYSLGSCPPDLVTTFCPCSSHVVQYGKCRRKTGVFSCEEEFDKFRRIILGQEGLDFEESPFLVKVKGEFTSFPISAPRPGELPTKRNWENFVFFFREGKIAMHIGHLTLLEDLFPKFEENGMPVSIVGSAIYIGKGSLLFPYRAPFMNFCHNHMRGGEAGGEYDKVD